MATHATLLVVELGPRWDVAASSVLATGYHYGIAQDSDMDQLVAYRGGSSVRDENALTLDRYRLSDWSVADSYRLPPPAGAVHQIAYANGGVYLANTAHNAVTFLADGGAIRHDFAVDGHRLDRNHVNSVFPAGDLVFVMLHNSFRRESELLILRHDPRAGFRVHGRKSLWDAQCHNLFVDDDQLAYNASSARSFVVADPSSGKAPAKIPFREHTKGLAVTEGHFIIGASEFTSRDERSTSSGWLAVIDRKSLEITARVDLTEAIAGRPLGNINEVRIVSQPDLGHAAVAPPDIDWGGTRLAGARRGRLLWKRTELAATRPLRAVRQRYLSWARQRAS